MQLDSRPTVSSVPQAGEANGRKCAGTGKAHGQISVRRPNKHSESVSNLSSNSKRGQWALQQVHCLLHLKITTITYNDSARGITSALGWGVDWLVRDLATVHKRPLPLPRHGICRREGRGF